MLKSKEGAFFLFCSNMITLLFLCDSFEMLLVCLRKPEWNWHTDIRRANLAVLDNTNVVPITNQYGNAIGPDVLFSVEWINHVATAAGGGMMSMMGMGGGGKGANRNFGGGMGGGNMYSGRNGPQTNMGFVDFTNMGGKGGSPGMKGAGGRGPPLPPSRDMIYGRPQQQLQQQRYHQQQQHYQYHGQPRPPVPNQSAQGPPRPPMPPPGGKGGQQ